MYLLCSDWSIRSLEKEKEKEKEKEEENCHLLNTARRTDEGRDKNWLPDLAGNQITLVRGWKWSWKDKLDIHILTEY